LRVVELLRARTLAEGLKIPSEKWSDAFEPERGVREAKVVALSYWLAPARSFAWLVKPSGVEFFVLPPAKEIEAAVDAYAKDLVGPRGTLAASGARGQSLYRILVEPASRSIDRGSHVAIIPDGRLATLNFETLVVPEARPHYWIEDVTLTTAPSLQLLTAIASPQRVGRMLLIGNAPQVDAAFPPLPHAGTEIERIQKHFDRATLLTGSQATPGAYRSSAPETYAFLHFVAHGVATRVRPLDSAVILGRDKGGYKLYARAIVAQPLTARLVTISSCHGAGRRAFEGEGLVGLAWAFLRAGAHEVIAALWEVSDAATPGLMDTMYASIRAGRAPADALRIAKLELLRSRTIYNKPMYWAPFVLYSGS
jgi:CHAT domain-containing protein